MKFLKKSKKIKAGNSGRDLYRTKENLLFWLDSSKYLDRCIIENGVFEEKSTSIVKQLIKTGDCVLDVGANIGYYSVVFSKLVGSKGKVLCFEPTVDYRNILLENLKENNAGNCEVFDFGFSDKKQELEISVGECSATLHWVEDFGPTNKEIVKLVRLDDFVKSKGIEKIDFIKVDVDGHEPACLAGAWEAIEGFKPVILLEVNHGNYLKYGITAWDFYNFLKEKGLCIFSEKNLKEFSSQRQFLIECANFAYSANIILAYPEKSQRINALS